MEQVRQWNREVGYEKYDSRIVAEFPTGPGARQAALDAEKKNTERLRGLGEIDPERQQRP